MAVDTQTHHVLPNAVYINFASAIAEWTIFDYSQNAGYDLIQLPKDTSGSTVQADNPGHSGSHPGLNNAWINVLQNIKDRVADGTITNAEAGSLFKQAHSHFRGGLDLQGNQTDNPVLLNNNDPELANVNPVTDADGNIVDPANGVGNAQQYTQAAHTSDTVYQSDAAAMARGENGVGPHDNGSYGSTNADTHVYGRGSQTTAQEFRDAKNIADQAVDPTTGQINTTDGGTYNGAARASGPGTGTGDGSGDGGSPGGSGTGDGTGDGSPGDGGTGDGSNNPGNPTPPPSFGDSANDAITAESTRPDGTVNQAQIDRGTGAASSFADSVSQSAQNGGVPDFNGLDAATQSSVISGVGNVVVGDGGGVIGDVAEFANVSYDAFVTGAKTGDWSDFGGVVQQYGVAVVVSAAVVGVTVGIAGAAFGAGAAAAVAAGWAIYGAYDAIVNGAELAGKIYDDFKDGTLGEIWDGLLNQFLSAMNYASPLVLDLDGDGIELTSVNGATAFFDVNVDGFAEATGWVAADDGLLAYDINGNGIIDDGTELYGDQTGHAHGFQALAQLDSNGDGIVDASDTLFDGLVVWHDLNSDGISQAGEMRSLADVGIASISVQATTTSYWVAGNEIRYESSFTWADGSTGVVGDAFFATDEIRTVAKVPDGFEYHPDVFKLPTLAGAGHLASTRVVMSENDALRQQAMNLVALASTGDIAAFRTGFEDFAMAWAGVDSIAPGSRGANIDAQHLAFMEVVFDENFNQRGSSNPRGDAGRDLTAAFEPVLDAMALEFLSQVAVSNALLNATDAASYASLLEGNPLAVLGEHSDDATAAFIDLVAMVDAGTIDTSTAQAMLQLVESSYPSTQSFDADLRAGVEAVATSSAAVFHAIYQSGASNYVTGTAAAESLSSGSGAVFKGLEGNDTLSGSSQADVFLYALGDGSDLVYDGGGFDRLIFTDQGVDDVTFSTSYSSYDWHLHVAMADGSTVTVSDQFSHDNVEQIAFSDGTVLDLAGIRTKLVEDEMAAGGSVHGTRHGDQFVYEAGMGSMTIYDGGGSDRFVFSDLMEDDVTFSRAYRSYDWDLDIALADGTKITVDNQFSHNNIEQIEFADGTILDLAGIVAKEGDDSLLV